MPPIRVLLAVGLAVGLAGCTSRLETAAVEDRPGASAGGEDACGAADWQSVVGQSVAVLNTADLPDGTRVLFPGVAMTEDFSAGRLNIEVGTSDAITRAFCG